MHLRTLIIVLLTLAVLPNGSVAQGGGGPLEIDGQAATRIVTTPAGSGALAIVAGTTLYTHENGAWEPGGTTVPAGQVVSSGDDTGVMLAGDHPPCMRGGAATALHRSGDGGVTWAEVEGGQDLRPLAIWPDSQMASAASCAGLHLSRDNGVTWTPVPGIEPGWEITAFADVENADSGPTVLVGLTGEGGTSYLRRVDFLNPDAPVVSDDLRTYYAVGGLAARGETYLLAAMDGLWVSEDAGATWERHAEGLEAVALEQDPAEVGFPADFDPTEIGLYTVAMLPGERGGAVLGSVDGLYLGTAGFDAFTKIEGTSGRVEQMAIDASGTLVLYRVGDAVFTVPLPE